MKDEKDKKSKNSGGVRKSYGQEVKNEAIRLYKDKKSIKQIADILEIKCSTIKNWVYSKNIVSSLIIDYQVEIRKLQKEVRILKSILDYYFKGVK